jgi:hypothetical protein
VCLFVGHPWPYPWVVALDVILLHPLQGVDTMLAHGNKFHRENRWRRSVGGGGHGVLGFKYGFVDC